MWRTAVVVYDNPLDNVEDLADIFFTRCLEAHVVPYVVTKKTVLKWQEGFWQKMKAVFDAKYKEQYLAAGLLKQTGGDSSTSSAMQPRCRSSVGQEVASVWPAIITTATC